MQCEATHCILELFLRNVLGECDPLHKEYPHQDQDDNWTKHIVKASAAVYLSVFARLMIGFIFIRVPNFLTDYSTRVIIYWVSLKTGKRLDFLFISLPFNRQII